MSSTGTVQPGVGAPEEKPAQVLRQSKTGMGQGSATWPVKIFMAVLCVLWMIPVIGLLINSFRSRDDQLSSGWWTAFFSPFSTQWTLAELRVGTRGERHRHEHGAGLRQQLHRDGARRR